MTVKVMALIARRPGLSREAFVQHYETSHVKLVWRAFKVADYRRNYVDLRGAIMAPGVADPDFDSLTEIWFASRADYEGMMSGHAGTDIGEQVAADEDRFLDRSKMRFFLVEEHGATTAGNAGGPGKFKVVALLSRKPDLSKADFIAYYETRHAPLIRSKFDSIVEYRRNFVDLAGAIIADTVAPPDFDVVTELWFKDRADYERLLAAHAIPEIGLAIADDEANFLDRSKTRFFVVEESAAR